MDLQLKDYFQPSTFFEIFSADQRFKTIYRKTSGLNVYIRSVECKSSCEDIIVPMSYLPSIINCIGLHVSIIRFLFDCVLNAKFFFYQYCMLEWQNIYQLTTVYGLQILNKT